MDNDIQAKVQAHAQAQVGALMLELWKRDVIIAELQAKLAAMETPSA